MNIKQKKISQSDLKQLDIDISKWSSWECDPSQFDWEYCETETAYVFEGDVIVSNESGEEANIKGGYLVQFPEGMKCHWNVRKTIRKVFTFDEIKF